MRACILLSIGLLLLAATLSVSAQEKSPKSSFDEKKRPSAGPAADGGTIEALPATQAGPAIIVHPTPTPTATSSTMPPSRGTPSPSPATSPTVSGTPTSPPLTPQWTATPTPTSTRTPVPTATPTPGVFRFTVSPKPGEDGKIRFGWGVNVQAEEVFLKVYSSGFRLVHGWHFHPKDQQGYLAVGAHEFTWDGRDAYGRKFPPGLYLCFIDIRVGTKHFEASGRTEIP